MARVTPFAGVWIEIAEQSDVLGVRNVTPFAGVWIEMKRNRHQAFQRSASLPSRECGLKYHEAHVEM